MFSVRGPLCKHNSDLGAYELLFRSGAENFVRPGRSCAEDVSVNSTMLLDMQQRVGNALAFINADAPALAHEAPCLLSPRQSGILNPRNRSADLGSRGSLPRAFL